MNAGKAVYGILSANSGVTDIVGTNIFPEIAEQETAVPFIVYQLQNVAPEDTHDGPSKLDEIQFEFLCYADSYNAAADLGVAVRAALDRVSGTYNGVHVESVQFNDVDVEIEYDPRRYSQVLKFTFRIKRDDVTIALGTPVTGAVLGDLSDVDVTGVTNGQLIAYNSTSGNWEAANDAGGAEELDDLSDVKIVGTPSEGDALVYQSGFFQLGQAGATTLGDLSDVNTTGAAAGSLISYNGVDGWEISAGELPSDQVYYHNRYASEAETLLDGATETVELYYTAQADGDGLHEDAQTDTATTGYDIRRKVYYAEKAQADPNNSGDWTQFAAIADDTTYASAKATLLAYLKARTGGTVPISLKMTWEEVAEAPSFTGLLNESYGSGASAAYGTRRLNGNYSGACMTIRRASDGTTQAIGFVGEEIDESAITTFCTGTTCTVQVWHDQSQTGGTGSGNDATAPTTAAQPTIYTGGQLVKEGGRLALDFDGNSDILDASLTIANDFTAIVMGLSTNTTNNKKFICDQTNSKGQLFVHSGNYNWFDGSTVTALQTADTSSHLFFVSANSGGSFVSIDGVDKSITGIANTGYGELKIGGRTISSQYLDGQIQEIIFYPTDKRTDRTSIEGNISGYYQSAKLLDEQFGENAAAAYSTRQLRRAQTDCMVIRRASDSTTQTIGFDANGNIDEAAINTFCSGTTCTVYQWIDQSGNGNTATAAAQANEPTIYTGGALVKENGKVALDFDGANDYVVTSQLSTVAQPTTRIAVGSFDDTTTAGKGYLMDGHTLRQVIGEDPASPVEWRLYSGTINDYSQGPIESFRYLMYANFNTSSEFFIDGVSLGAKSVGTQGYDGVTIGAMAGPTKSVFHDGKIQESIIYTALKSSGDQTSIEENVGDYFTQNTPLLDTYTGAAACYSLRLMRTAYTGSAIRVRRASDNTEQDIGFNVFGELDTVSLASFCSGTNGFVKTWYDQASTNDATQTNTANQPKIYDSSTGVLTFNGKPYVDARNNCILPAIFTVAQPFTIFAAARVTAAPQRMLHGTGISFQNATTTRLNAGVNLNGATSIDGTIQHIFTGLGNGTSSKVFYDGSEDASGDAGTNSISNPTIFTRVTATTSGTPYAYEMIIYPSDQSSNRTNIEDNINTFYSIY